jgi:hypothetical protein
MPSAATLSRLGVTDNTTDGSFAQDNELFLEIFSGEVLTAFSEKNVFLDKHMQRTIESGKSAQFPATWKTDAKYHTPGQATHENASQMAHNARTILVDDLLYDNLIIYEMDELRNHYDVRREYSRQLGAALSRGFDKRISQMLVKAARASATVSGGSGGSVLNKGGTVATDGSVLAGAVFEAAQTMDEKDIPDEDRYFAVRPAQYYLLVQNKDTINKDWGGQGSYSDGSIIRIADLEIVKTNNLPNSVISSETGENNDYSGDFSTTVGCAWHRSAAGTVKLKDLTTQMTGEDFRIMYQADMLLAKYAMGHGILRPESSVEVSSAT